MEQRIMSIYEFKPGDIITRMVPSKPMTVIGDETIVDRGYIGDELMFVGIANGCVNVEKVSHRSHDIVKVMFQPLLVSLPLDAYSEGWSYYIDPYTLLDDYYSREISPEEPEGLTIVDVKKIPEESEESLNRRLQIAIDNQEFEKAEVIKKDLEKIKNKTK